MAMTPEGTMIRSAREVIVRRLGDCARRFAGDRSASNAIEYALLTFIAAAIIVAVSQLGGAVTGLYVQVQNAMGSP